MRKIIAALALCFSFTTASIYAAELKVLSDRTEHHLEALVKQYEQETGNKVTLTLIGKGINEQVKVGGFDIMITKSSSELIVAKREKVLKPIAAETIAGVPVEFRDVDNMWVMLSYRIRAIFVHKFTADWPTSYTDLARPQYKGRICMRPLTDNYNLELFGIMLHDMGKKDFTDWFRRFKANLARDPTGNDRSQIKAIFDVRCDVAIVNTYYKGVMDSDPTQKLWSENTVMLIPDQGSKENGAIVMFSGAGVLSDNPANNSFITFLLRPDIQRMISTKNFEYPIDPKNTSEEVHNYGRAQRLNAETIKIHPNVQEKLFDLRRQAYIIVKEN